MNTFNNQETGTNLSMRKLLPVMSGFFIMGFVDLIGIAINYVKSDLALTDSLVNLISFSCFFSGFFCVIYPNRPFNVPNWTEKKRSRSVLLLLLQAY